MFVCCNQDPTPLFEIDLSRGAVLITERESAYSFPFVFSVQPIPPPASEKKGNTLALFVWAFLLDETDEWK